MTNNSEHPNSKTTQRPQQQNQFYVSLLENGESIRAEYITIDDVKSALEKSKLTWVNYTTDDIRNKGEEVAVNLGFTPGLVTKLMERQQQSEYEDNDVDLGILVPAVYVINLQVKVTPLIILMRKGVILTIAGKEVVRLVRFSRYATTFMRKIPKKAAWNDILTLALIRILDENNDRNFDYLREIECQADELSKDLMDPKTPRTKIGPAIYEMKHALITYMNALWDTLDVINNLRYGDAEVITDDPKILERITMLSSDINQQLALSEHMSEVLASGLEVLQTIYNNQLQMLNNRLAWLATWLAIIGTAILVPNTLATVYGIAPIAEHLGYEFIFTSLITTSIVSAVLVFGILKWKKWMPAKEEW